MAPVRTAQIAEAARQLEDAFSRTIEFTAESEPDQVLATIGHLVDAKNRIDEQLDHVIALRSHFAKLAPSAVRRSQLQQFLRTASTLIELSGRLRALERDAIFTGSYLLDADLTKFGQLLDLLVEHRVSVGATTLSYVLFDPPPESGANPYPLPVRRRMLKLIEVTRQPEMIPHLVRLVEQPAAPASLRIEAAELIRHIGLPQQPRPNRDPTLPEPAVTPLSLRDALSTVVIPRNQAVLRRRRTQLYGWLNRRLLEGVTADRYRIGPFEVREGDWLLMRNPSPYNRFTDLSPGLFTHVGVVTTEVGDDGIRRFVLVDLPERGDQIPATNVDIYLERTVHYFFLRHENPVVSRRMGDVARTVIGNPSQFDLTFRTDRARQLAGQSLAGRTINTYCAGFLLLCAGETGLPATHFFPISEFPAGKNCAHNLRKLGLSIGDNFLSPTGAMFSPHLQLVGQREPMYTPDRAIREVVFDHFASSMIHRQLTPAPDAVQALREKLASLSKYNPWLARALAKANNVSENIDLESAAKAAAVIETLDEIADGNMNAFLLADEALRAGPVDELRRAGVEARTIESIQRFRAGHKELYAGWLSGKVTSRELQAKLVDYYGSRGKQQLDSRFFGKPPE